MFKFLIFRVIRAKVRKTLPSLNLKTYQKVFNFSYRFCYYLKPSSIFTIVLALLNKKGIKLLWEIPSLFILFNTIFSDSNGTANNEKTLFAKLESHNLTHEDNQLETFFLIIIILALIKRFIDSIFKLMWIPFKVAMYYYILKYLGFNIDYLYNVLNTLSFGVIDWFHEKITDFIELFTNNNDTNN